MSDLIVSMSETKSSLSRSDKSFYNAASKKAFFVYMEDVIPYFYRTKFENNANEMPSVDTRVISIYI